MGRERGKDRGEEEKTASRQLPSSPLLEVRGGVMMAFCQTGPDQLRMLSVELCQGIDIADVLWPVEV